MRQYFLYSDYINNAGDPILTAIEIASDDGRFMRIESIVVDDRRVSTWERQHWNSPDNMCNLSGNYKFMASQIETFIDNKKEGIEFWANDSGYTWVLFCGIFGGMMSLPLLYPTYCRSVDPQSHRTIRSAHDVRSCFEDMFSNRGKL